VKSTLCKIDDSFWIDCSSSRSFPKNIFDNMGDTKMNQQYIHGESFSGKITGNTKHHKTPQNYYEEILRRQKRYKKE